MTALEELQKRLDALPSEQREAVAAQLLEEWEAQEWDKRIEADAKAGKLDALIERAKQDHREGRTTRLP